MTAGPVPSRKSLPPHSATCASAVGLPFSPICNSSRQINPSHSLFPPSSSPQHPSSTTANNSGSKAIVREAHHPKEPWAVRAQAQLRLQINLSSSSTYPLRRYPDDGGEQLRWRNDCAALGADGARRGSSIPNLILQRTQRPLGSTSSPSLIKANLPCAASQFRVAHSKDRLAHAFPLLRHQTAVQQTAPRKADQMLFLFFFSPSFLLFLSSFLSLSLLFFLFFLLASSFFFYLLFLSFFSFFLSSFFLFSSFLSLSFLLSVFYSFSRCLIFLFLSSSLLCFLLFVF